METGFREIDSPPIIAIARFKAMNTIEPGSARVRAISILVGQRGRMPTGVPLLTVHHTGMTANTRVEIDDKTETFLATLLGK
jgi:hypothetical protein